MSRKKPRARLSWNPRCPNRCEQGWLRVTERRMGREYTGVKRCSCVRVEVIGGAKPKPAKKKGAGGHDAKQAAAGEN